MKKVILSALAIAAVVFSAAAADGDKTATVTVGGELLSQLSISTTPGSNDVSLGGNVAGGVLQFGKIGLSGAASRVLVSPAGVRTQDLGNPGLSNTTPTPTGAAFYVTGSTGMTYNVALPGAATTLTGGGGACTVSGYNIAGGGSTTSLTSRTFNASGYDAFAVGASLNIPAGATAGALTGSFTVTINYN